MSGDFVSNLESNFCQLVGLSAEMLSVIAGLMATSASIWSVTAGLTATTSALAWSITAGLMATSVLAWSVTAGLMATSVLAWNVTAGLTVTADMLYAFCHKSDEILNTDSNDITSVCGRVFEGSGTRIPWKHKVRTKGWLELWSTYHSAHGSSNN